MLKKAVEKNPADQALYQPLIEALVESKYYDIGLKYSEKLLGLKSDSTVGLFYAGTCSQELGLWDNALDYYKKLCSAAPDIYSGYYKLGALYYKEGRYKESIELLKTAASKMKAGIPEQLEILNVLGDAYYYDGNKLDAYKTLDNILAADPQNKGALHNYGVWKFRESKYSEAEEYLKKLISISPDDASAHFRLGQVYYNSGNLDRAQEILGSAGQLDPFMKTLAAVIHYQKLESTYNAVNTAMVKELEEYHFKNGENYISRGIIENVGLEIAKDVTVTVQFLGKNKQILRQDVFEISPRNLMPQQYAFFSVNIPYSEDITGVIITLNWQKRRGDLEFN